jgi:hypothetical protein
MTHPADLSGDDLLAVCDVGRTRRSGPGGQHRNKVETAIVLTHRPTGLTAEAGERRSSVENRRAALGRLRLRLALEVRTVRSRTSARWSGRVRDGRLAINPSHDDYPALVAEALDVLAVHAWEAPAAAAQLGVSSSQLVRLLGHEPRALVRVNEERAALGRPPLRT